jgi:hypothetical protein
MRLPVVMLIAAQTVLQVALHCVPLLGRWVDIAGMGRNYSPTQRYLGVLTNAFDNFSYAAWVEQARQGSVLMRDLYTTEAHAAALFNPYFLTMGWGSVLSGWEPIMFISLVGVMTIPIFGWLVSLIATELSLTPKGQFLAVLLAYFATGPSVLLAPLRLLTQILHAGATIPEGIDLWYSDLFPATTFISYPYHSFCLTCSAAVLLCALRTLRAEGGSGRVSRVAVCAMGVAALVFTRPFQGAVLGWLYPIALVLRGLAMRRPWREWLREAVVAVAIVLPAVAYIAAMSQLAVWNYLSQGYRMIEVTRWDIALGFSLFWLGSAMGVARAWRARRIAMLLPCLWFFATVLEALTLGRSMTKLADAAVIDYAILTAYGLEPLLSSRGAVTRERRSPATTAALFAIAVAIGTTVLADIRIVHSVTPEVDEEILAIAKALRTAAPTVPPVVLANCSDGLVLPAFAAVQVYAGHWGLTVDYAAKCDRLVKAGLDPAHGAAASEAEFRSLLSDLQPQYMVVAAGALADGWIDPRAAVVWSGKRWRLLSLVGGQH